jgi:3-hydroxyacyl-CoA dehydrogenase/enoyl-CoA hydratase/carnithine racemase
VSDTLFKLRRAGTVALVTIDNGEDWQKPTFLGRAALESLASVLDELEHGDFEALVLTGKPFVFCAGADVDEFPGIERERAIAGSRAGHELFGRLRSLPFPSVAAVNGVCLGGGLELALHCSARTISPAVRHVGCPEVFLGLVPGWGGTQLLPRLLGPEAAVTLVVSNPLRQNRLLDGRQAFELGLADRLIEPPRLVDESIAFALDLARGGGLERVEPEWAALEQAIRRGRGRADDAVHGAAPAAYRALDLIEGAATWSLEEGYAEEERVIGELLPGPQAQASIYAFDLVERRAKRQPGRPAADPRPVQKVGIVGAGLMATQLAALVLRRLEVPVVLRDVEEEIVHRGLTAVREALEDATARGRLSEDRARFLGSIVSGSTGYDGFASCDLVLEAVVEEPAVKRRVFGELREVVEPRCVLATNTSALSVREMGADLGMHFFNPVALMPLVELVRTPSTDDVQLATAFEVASRLRKRPVVVADAPAFVVNRVLTRLTTVVLDSLEHGNSVEEVDEAILGLGLPMAPSVLLAMVGPQVANRVLRTLHDAFPDRFPLSPTLESLAAGSDEIVVVERRPRDAAEIRTAALEAVADEVHRLLEERVVPTAEDVDTCLLLGAGWPFFLGGITKHLDQTGVSERLFGRPFAAVH